MKMRRSNQPTTNHYSDRPHPEALAVAHQLLMRAHTRARVGEKTVFREGRFEAVLSRSTWAKHRREWGNVQTVLKTTRIAEKPRFLEGFWRPVTQLTVDGHRSARKQMHMGRAEMKAAKKHLARSEFRLPVSLSNLLAELCNFQHLGRKGSG